MTRTQQDAATVLAQAMAFKKLPLSLFCCLECSNQARAMRANPHMTKTALRMRIRQRAASSEMTSILHKKDGQRQVINSLLPKHILLFYSPNHGAKVHIQSRGEATILLKLEFMRKLKAMGLLLIGVYHNMSPNMSQWKKYPMDSLVHQLCSSRGTHSENKAQNSPLIFKVKPGIGH